MARDFTLTKYERLIETIIHTKYTPISVCDYLTFKPNNCIIIRHDVDREAKRALDMAKLEYNHGIASTYYFRFKTDVFKPEIIHKIADMGHEIGFHYEVLDKTKGNTEKAIELFKRELEELRNVTNIKTACMHGNPFAAWSNRDLWEKYNFEDFGIIGEPYISINYEEVLYLTDTGRTWADLNIRVKDVVNSSDGGINSYYKEKIISTDDVIKLIQTKEIKQICILAHPNRWCDNTAGWTKEIVCQNLKNIGKAGIVRYRNIKKK